MPDTLLDALQLSMDVQAQSIVDRLWSRDTDGMKAALLSVAGFTKEAMAMDEAEDSVVVKEAAIPMAPGTAKGVGLAALLGGLAGGSLREGTILGMARGAIRRPDGAIMLPNALRMSGAPGSIQAALSAKMGLGAVAAHQATTQALRKGDNVYEALKKAIGPEIATGSASGAALAALLSSGVSTLKAAKQRQDTINMLKRIGVPLATGSAAYAMVRRAKKNRRDE